MLSNLFIAVILNNLKNLHCTVNGGTSSIIDNIFLQLLPVAPLYGDVQIRFADWVRQLPHSDPSKWTCTSESQEEKVTVAIQSRVETIRSEHVRFISELARYNNEVSMHTINYIIIMTMLTPLSLSRSSLANSLP